jgi:NADH dehydrogenase
LNAEPTERRVNPEHHVLVVGGGFGGLAVAQGLGGIAGIRVTLIDRRNYHLFQPLLYQVATSVLSPSEIAEPIRGILRKHANVTVLLGEVDGVEPERKLVHLADGGELAYDTLVLATGATHSYFGHSEWARFAPGLKTLDDARRIRSSVLLAFEQAERSSDIDERRRYLTFAVIGGGPTGVEVAGAIAGLAKHALAGEFRNIDPAEATILLVEAAPRILGAFPENLARYAQDALSRLGVSVRTGKPVEDITEEGLTVGGEVIPAATVIWGAGVQASPVGRWLGLETDRAGHVPVGPDLSVQQLDDIYVIGDAALARGEGGQPLPGLPGRAAAGAISRPRVAGPPVARTQAGPIPLPQSRQPGGDRPERGCGAVGQHTAQGVRCLGLLERCARLSSGGISEPLVREPALALGLREQAARLSHHPGSLVRGGNRT